MKYHEKIQEAISMITEHWGENGTKVVENAFRERRRMSMDYFLSNCTACGGNWGGMFLTGIKKLFPDTWESIPNEMGVFAFPLLCCVLTLCGVEEDNK